MQNALLVQGLDLSPTANSLERAITNAPQAKLRNQLLETQNQESQLLFRQKDASSDAYQALQLLESDPQAALGFIDQRIEKVRAREGNPYDSEQVKAAIQSGNIEGAKRYLQAVVGAGQKAGVFDSGKTIQPGFIGTPQRVTDGEKNYLTGLYQDASGNLTTPRVEVSGQFISPLGETAGEQTTRNIDEAGGKKEAEITAETKGATDKKFMEKIGEEGARVYSALQQAAQSASAFIPRLQSLKALASTVETGTGAEIKLAAKKALGIDSADMEELNAKLGELAQDILNQQTGTKTDFDFQNAVRQSAALGKTKEANVRLIDALINRQLEAVNFADQAREAYDQGGVKAVLDMRYKSSQQGVEANKGENMSIDDLVNKYAD